MNLNGFPKEPKARRIYLMKPIYGQIGGLAYQNPVQIKCHIAQLSDISC